MSNPISRRNREFWWAIVRLLLATIQIAGATASLILLFQTGASGRTIAAVGVTMLFTILSRIVFSRRDRAAGK
jgi:hypothetical protein